MGEGEEGESGTVRMRRENGVKEGRMGGENGGKGRRNKTVRGRELEGKLIPVS